ncbi:uncharacterized protein LOC142235509 [Haematobia irritans]|uniref:uncharacterized protein LOC142235509 n=1 Tax=Haematobia irritans TaxID=7368 RepID=UPI003F4F8BB0
MYRQILLHPHDRPYQRILFRRSTDGPIKDYQLKTVTFGINCAPFLAIRTLLQLASDYEEKYPRVAEILRRETYVDDILSGGFSMEEALKAQAELIEVLTQAGFPLKKIIANDPELLSHIPSQDLYDSDVLRFHESSSTKTLGVKWNALSDSFTYSLKPFEYNQLMTKRMVLSAIVQLYDPAGWIAPVIIRSKILMQQLWLEGIGWDDNLSPESQSTWDRLVSDLSHVNSITIPRWLQYCPSDKLEIHGFSDASQAAYCTCVYIRCQTQKIVVFSNLFVAKRKVAPLKPVCLPRLELNGAYLLAKLVKYVVSTLNLKFSAITLWTDSSIVLGWLSKPPWSWETYVANRTAQIHDLVPGGIWRHVPTHDNPADLGTRKSCSQIMAPLPPLRCTLSPPYHITGIDFAGPFELKSSTLRRSPIIKGYVSIFVCFATKAIHLEPCSELSSLAFEAAFTRFVGRRGLPQRLVSDNGRNFIGASRKMLKEFASFVKTTAHDIAQKYSAHGFEWQFIPPHAPHMGGLWESAVKSFKHHFKRIAGAHRFTFEQFATILARIEGLLNSRPTSAISEDPSDLVALKPGHFLKGSPIMSFPEPPAQNLSLVNRWTKLKALHHQFAIRWKEDYLKTLHKRYKWKNSSPNLKIGDLVAVMDDLLPPNDWRLGRIINAHRGSDDNIRVADTKRIGGSQYAIISTASLKATLLRTATLRKRAESAVTSTIRCFTLKSP